MKQRTIILTSIFQIVFVYVEFGRIVSSLGRVKSNRNIVQAECVVEDRCAVRSIVITIFDLFRRGNRVI